MKRPFVQAALIALALALTSLPQASRAQDFVGFDRASFGRVVLDRKQAAGGGPDITLELAVGDYNNESITNYSQESIFAQMGLSVGRLDILTDKGVFPCTAFIVDEKHILTNHHCVPGILDNERAGATRIDSVMFVTGYTQQGVEEGTNRYTVIPHPVETNKDLDYSVLEVIGNPSETYGTLDLATRLPKDGDPYWVIGHPMGEAQRISREKCRANRPAVSNKRLLHTCDTLPGNSGSPLIDASSQMVIGLHHAGSNRDAVNFAIPMGAILENSNVLQAAQPGGTGQNPGQNPGQTGGGTQPPQGAALCDALYNEAKAYGQCFAYEAYLETCAQHPFAVLARGFVARECTEGGGGVAPPPTKDETQTTELLRPWCSANRLTPTEATICGDRYLAGLDEELDRAYRSPARSVTSADQSRWRLSQRDSCGTNTQCIASAVIERVAYLKTPASSGGGGSTGGGNTGGGGTQTVAGNFELSDSCYIITASRPSISEARAFISQWFGTGQGVRMFRSSNGFYGIALKTVSRSNSDWELSNLKNKGSVPSDSYCSTGSRFVEEVLWNGGNTSGGGGGTGGGFTMYIDGTSSLNVRTGPGTQFNRITAVDWGTPVTVIRESDGWANITFGSTTGWVSAKFLSRSRPTQQACTATVVNLNPYSSRTRSDGTGYLNIRSQNSTRGNIISETYLGDRMQVLSRSGNWAQVRCTSGQCLSPYRGTGGVTGWASAKFLSIRCQ